jgi:hypothetical protein
VKEERAALAGGSPENVEEHALEARNDADGKEACARQVRGRSYGYRGYISTL